MSAFDPKRTSATGQLDALPERFAGLAINVRLGERKIAQFNTAYRAFRWLVTRANDRQLLTSDRPVRWRAEASYQ
jgi:hypothetical protein